MYICMHTLNYFMLIWKAAVIEWSKETQNHVITGPNLTILFLQSCLMNEWKHKEKQAEEGSLALKSTSQEQGKSSTGTAVGKSFKTLPCTLFIVLTVRAFAMHLSLKKLS